jgi:hypothetical protein
MAAHAAGLLGLQSADHEVVRSLPNLPAPREEGLHKAAFVAKIAIRIPGDSPVKFHSSVFDQIEQQLEGRGRAVYAYDGEFAVSFGVRTNDRATTEMVERFASALTAFLGWPESQLRPVTIASSEDEASRLRPDLAELARYIKDNF